MNSVKTPVFLFLSLCAVAMTFALAQRGGLIEVSTSRRAIGIVIGLMALVIGNFVPKLRPLRTNGDGAAHAVAFERTVAWIMVFTGIAFVALFTLAPLDVARSLAPIVAFGGTIVILADWIWVATRRRPAMVADEPKPPARARRMIGVWLLFGVAYVLLMASLKMVVREPWVREFGAWSSVAFTTLYSINIVLVECRRRWGTSS